MVGALTGGVVAGFLPERVLAGLFAALLAYTALTMLRGLRGGESEAADAPAVDPAAPDGPDAPAYRSHRLPPARRRARSSPATCPACSGSAAAS